jgi:GT2 family glycosyltransferase
MHFSILAAPRKLLARHFKRPREPMTSDPAGLTLIPFGPYGGLFFHRSLLEVIGYPDTRMFVYSDDTEYTQRITRSGGSLFFVGSSVIHDIDTSWSLAAKGGNGLTRLLFADSDMRTYYATRNRVFFERYHWRASRALYYVNRTIYLTVLRATALMFRRRDRLRLLTRAVSEGEAADFGGTERGHSR